MAHYSFARLTLNGERLSGDVTVTNVAGIDVSTDHLELFSVAFGVDSARQAATGVATGRRQYRPITFVKRIDRATPLLYRALSRNERVDGDITLFDIDPVDGTTRGLLTVEVQQGSLTSIGDVGPDVRDQQVSTWDAYEEVALVFGRITITHDPSGIQFEDQFDKLR